MTDFTSLGIRIDTADVSKASDSLDELVDAAEGAEKAVDDLGKAGEGLANTGKKISQAETEAAQGIDKATGAKERQVDASRKAGTSAASEIAIISQLDKAMSGNIGSMEQLIQAEGLLERARKGGLVTIEQQESYQDRLGKAYERIEKAEAKEMAQKQRLIEAENRQIEALKRTVNSIDPVTAKLAKLEAQEKAAHEAFRLGAIDVDAYNAALAKVGKDRAGITATEGALDKLKLGTRQAQENVMQLTNALQSGDWGSGARAIAQLGAGAGASATSLIALAAPIALLTAAIGGLAYAYYKGSEEQDAFNNSLILTGGSAGLTASQLGVMAKQVGDTVGTTGQAAEVLATLAGNGKIAGESFLGVTQAAVSMQEATGKAVSETISEFAKIADEPVKASAALNEQYHYLTASVYSQIVALEEQGKHAEAVKLATNQYADAINNRTPKILENLSLWEKGYNLVARAADNLKNVGRSQTNAERIQTARETLSRLESRGGSEMIPGEDVVYIGEKGKQSLRDYIKGLEVKDAAETKFTKDQAARQKIEDDASAATTRADARHLANLSNEAKRALEIKKINEDTEKIRAANPNDKRVSAEYVAGQIKDVNEKYKDPKAAATQVDLTSFNNSKNALTGILSEYKNAQKELEAAQKAGLVSQADYLLKRQAMIGNERDEVTAAYEAEISALEATKGKAGTSAAQRIQLDQKIADARAAMVKAQKDADSELAVLASNEEGRLKKQAASLKTYIDALNLQTEALRRSGQRAVLDVGRGDRENALSGELNSQDDRFANASRELASQRSAAALQGASEADLDKEFGPRVAALAKQNQEATDQIRQNYADIETAQGDWTKGATSAWANYLDSAQNVAGQTKSLFTNAFSSMEDSLVNFAVTGKASFADFTKSILADMARIATRQASSALLGSLVGAATNYFVGSGTGATSPGSTQAGYTGVDFSGYRAAGGPVAPNSLYEVNELGPELYNEGGRSFLMTGANGGSVTPLTSGGGAGIAASSGNSAPATQINVQVSVASDGSTSATSSDPAYQQFGKDLGDFVEQKYRQLLRKDLGQGGSITRAIKG
jgi:lambda family phage tail tape measure protein